VVEAIAWSFTYRVNAINGTPSSSKSEATMGAYQSQQGLIAPDLSLSPTQIGRLYGAIVALLGARVSSPPTDRSHLIAPMNLNDFNLERRL